MTVQVKAILSNGYLINDDYTVAFFVKKGSYAETYRVKDKKGKTKVNPRYGVHTNKRSAFNKLPASFMRSSSNNTSEP